MNLLALFAALIAAASSPLPAPDGPHAVGVRHFELVDRDRHGVAEDDADQPRALPAIIWYPAARTDAPPAPYFTAAEAPVRIPALARIFEYDRGEVAPFATIRTHGVADAPPLDGPARYPVVIFSHGFYLYANQNTALAEQLASHGYIVIAIDHPRDAIDVRTQDGRMVATNMEDDTNEALFTLLTTLFAAPSHEERVAALGRYRELFPASRMGISLFAWRDDTLFTVRALRSGAVPAAIRPILASADTDRIALAGMSYGGTAAATTCRLILQCRAILDLDGDNYEPALFDGDVERPMLLIQSDWTRHEMVPGQPGDPGFNGFDYGFERWSQAGTSGHVLRVRIENVTHLGLTDLASLMPGPEASERFGAADPTRVATIVGALSLAFLDQHLKDGGPAPLERVVRHTLGLTPHDPAEVRRWARSRRRP